MRRSHPPAYTDAPTGYPFDPTESLVGLDVVDLPPIRRADAPHQRRARKAQRPRGRVGVAPRRWARMGSWLRAVAVTLLALAVVAALAAALDWTLTSPYWRVRQVAVQGTRDAAVMAAIRTLPLAGCDIFRCDLTHDARLILGSSVAPLIAQVGVARVYPDTLTATVALRRPTVLWRLGGQTFVVASDGVVLGPVVADGALAIDPALSLAGLPLVTAQGTAAQRQALKPGDDLGETVIAMAAQLRLSVIAGLLGVASADVTLTYDGAAVGQGFVATACGAPQVIFGGPDAAAAMVADMAPQPTQSATQAGASTETGLAAPSGELPDVATVTQGARLQLDALGGVLALLAQNGQQATLIDLRWGAHLYYVVV
ncbi:MAG TPA: hypothetical protein VMV29_14005 [Ktedonobacterales bacterium]|nr:hypothetical protein [Ktedonobacterales bacterium]